MEQVFNFSDFGVKHINHLLGIILPEGHTIVKDWFLMKWWQVALFSVMYPFIMGNIRIFRFESHPKPIHAFSTIGLFFTIFSVIVYVLILYEIFSFYAIEHFFACHQVDLSEKNIRMASVLWFFHVSRVFFDVVNTIQSALTKPVSDLRSEQSINEIRFTLTHFIVWWMVLLYYPGGEVLYPVATVCMFYLGTITCAFSPGKFITLKMGLWVVLVLANFLRIGSNLWSGCKFPSALLTISPPYDINTNVHMIIFYFLSWFPAGFSLHYILYGRGSICTWWTLLIFLICAHWPSSSENKDDYYDDSQLSLLSSGKGSKKVKRDKIRKKKAEKLKDDRTLQIYTQTDPRSFLGNRKKDSGNNIQRIPGSIYRKCSRAMCTNYEEQPKEFKICQRCKSPYCSKECQILDWQLNHKIYCKKFENQN